MDSQIESVMKRGRGYWFVDGFTEILAGILFILLGGITLLSGIVPPSSFLSQFVSLAESAAIVKFLGLILAVLGLWWLKDRFTYPRTGFVREKGVPRAQLLIFLRNAVLIAILPVLGLIIPLFVVPAVRGAIFSMPVWFPPVLGIFWGALCILLGEWTALRRFRLLGVVIMLAGISIGIWQLTLGLPNVPADALRANILSPLPDVLWAPVKESLNRVLAGVGLLTLLSGIAFAVSGLATFLRYRKENPVPYREES
ncbi:MAG: hypothetical protein ABSA10_09910 [Anaerolineales bacterium]|jgi:hypothetical protein